MKSIQCIVVALGFVLSPWLLFAQQQPVATVKPVAQRIADRTFPSVFQAWSPADNLAGEDPLKTMARHDLIWAGPEHFGLKWEHGTQGLSDGFTAESIVKARQLREKLLALNPNMILLAEVRYYDAPANFLPKDHQWWLRQKDGSPTPGWEEGKYLLLNFADPEFQQRVATCARACVQSGVFDGVMLDWWHENDDRVALLAQVRKAVGDEALIIVNTNDETAPKSAPLINGLFMECYRSETTQDWARIATTLRWAETNLRKPHINCVETWYHKSRQDLEMMRAVTTLALTHSDGYCLFSDPNPLPTPDHLHNWYPFWNKSLGKPLAKAVTREDGTIAREFEQGTAVYNPPGNKRVRLVFPDMRTSLALVTKAREHSLNAGDGDIFLHAVAGSDRQ